VRSFDGHRPEIGSGVFIHDTALVIGRVSLAADVSVWPTTVIRGDVNWIRIGARTNLQDGCVLHVTHDGPYTPGGFPLDVGEDVTVGHRVVLHAATVGDRVLVGMGSVVMDGAVIEDDVLLGAGALVPPGKRLQSGRIYAGSPARPVRELREEELESLRYSSRQYVDLKNRYLAGADDRAE
jgi:carbonic anhydrase/acetyltransferase-like protein (isoleucine patch superfamily)